VLTDGVYFTDVGARGQQGFGSCLEVGETDACGWRGHEGAAAAGDDGDDEVVGPRRPRQVQHRLCTLDAALARYGVVTGQHVDPLGFDWIVGDDRAAVDPLAQNVLECTCRGASRVPPAADDHVPIVREVVPIVIDD
jgi:hypothetical protein